MASEDRLQQRIEDLAEEAIGRWKNDKANLSNYVKEIFPSISGSSIVDAAKRIADKVGGPAVTGAVLGGLTQNALVAIGAGVGISIVIEALNIRRRQRQEEERSPYRYLSLVERSGLGYSIAR